VGCTFIDAVHHRVYVEGVSAQCELAVQIRNEMNKAIG
jgi:hypothetical protein